MAITTMTELLDALEALSVTGVTKTFQGPPRKLDTAQLPAKWVQLPTVEEGGMTFGTHGGWPTLRAELVIAYQAVGQDLQENNFQGAVTQLDRLLTAFRGVAPTGMGKSHLEWEGRQDLVTVGEVPFWAVIAIVTARG